MLCAFANKSFNEQMLRTLSHSYFQGSDVSEVAAISQKIADGEVLSWHDNFYSLGEKALHQKRFLAASEYFRQAFYFLRDSLYDVRIARCLEKHQAALECYLDEEGEKWEVVENPLFRGIFIAGDPEMATLLLPCDMDSTAEEMYLLGGRAAREKGYSVFLIEGQGQGSRLFKGTILIWEYEKVIKNVIDWSQTHHPKRSLALIGRGFASYLAARACCFEPRIDALVVEPGLLSVAIHPLAKSDEEYERIFAQDPEKAFFFKTRMLMAGTSSPCELTRLLNQADVTHHIAQITKPTLVIDKGLDEGFFQALTTEKERYVLTTQDPEESQDFGSAEFWAVVFDWLKKHCPGKTLLFHG